MSTAPLVLVSVAICTHNRAQSLAVTLASVGALRDPGVPWELLVVDNNSSDGTRQVIEAFGEGHPVRVLAERRQGLSHARNRALRACRGDLIAFTDDDVTLDPGWLEAYAGARARHQNAGYFGGPIRVVWPAGRPAWVRDEGLPLIGGLLGHYDRGPDEHAYAPGEPHPYGANLALRRALWERVGEFRGDLGVSGESPGRGEEAEYLDRAGSAGLEGWYLPGASCGHRVQAAHLRLRHLYRYGIEKGVAAARIGPAPAAGGKWGGEALHVLRGLGQIVKGRGDRWRQCVINAGIERGLRRGRA